MAKSTALQCLKRFVVAVKACFGDEYLRHPTTEDIKKILASSTKEEFPGMLGSIDCCKWVRKNCPTAFHGQYRGKEGVPAMKLEALADSSLWFWHVFFGMPGVAIDINVLHASTLTNKIPDGTYPTAIEYIIANEKGSIPYWLADGIYPNCPMFLQTIIEHATKKEKLLAQCQEGRRKDVEREFGVLQAKWNILGRQSRFWYQEPMKVIMHCCVILHNVMVEFREGTGLDGVDVADDAVVGEGVRHVWALHM